MGRGTENQEKCVFVSKIVRHRMTRTLATFAVLALAITGASASANYSTTAEVEGYVYIEGNCSKGGGVSASPRLVEDGLRGHAASPPCLWD